MKRVVKLKEKRIELSEIQNSDITELIFEDPENWYITYDVQKCDYMVEYSQSSGHGEICGSCINTLRTGAKPLEFTSDGKSNIELLKSFKSEFPTYYRETICYKEIVKRKK